MANALYGKGKEKIGTGQINLTGDTIKAILLKSTYTPSINTHEFLSDISAYRLGTDVALSGRSFTLGVFDAADTIFTAVAAGDTGSYVALYKYTGVEATSPLIYLTDAITNFPVTTNGGDVDIQWDNGAYKIFSF